VRLIRIVAAFRVVDLCLELLRFVSSGLQLRLRTSQWWLDCELSNAPALAVRGTESGIRIG